MVDNRMIQVPVAFLQAPDLTASARILWLAQRLHPGGGPGLLESASGLSRETVLRMRNTVAAYSRSFAGRRVNMPAALLAERSVGPRAKLLFGLLQTFPKGGGAGTRNSPPGLT